MLIMMRGVPGAGKSTYVRKLLIPTVVCSADDFFIDSNGRYNFDPSKLPDAHAQCLRKAENALAEFDDSHQIVVDNTNILLEHMLPYERAAKLLGHRIGCVVVKCSVPDAFRRCTHGVPLSVIQRMAYNFEPHPSDIHLNNVVIEGA